MLRFQHHPKYNLCAIGYSMEMILLVADNAELFMDFVGTHGLSENAVCFHMLSNTFVLGLGFKI